MKYIRTKDGRIISKKSLDLGQEMFGIKWFVPENEILKQADTIEELCDEFVVYVKDNIKVVRMFPKGKAMEYSTYLKQTNNLDSEIYGAIWTDKGLIYVAKMNEKGELELL